MITGINRGNDARSFGEKWRDFWFSPGDPTVMSFLRIVVGCLALYVHIIYTLDLDSFFGENAWQNLETINRERRELPWQTGPLAWDKQRYSPNDNRTFYTNDQPRSTWLPEDLIYRESIVNYMKSLPADESAQDKAFALFRTIDQLSRPEYGRMILEYIRELSPNPQSREAALAALANKELRDPKREQYSEFIDKLPDADRARLIKEIEQFYQTLPHSPNLESRATLEQRNHVINYFVEIDSTMRENFFRFNKQNAKLTQEQRNQRINYLDYWNYEKEYAIQIGSPIFSFWFHIYDPTEMAIAHALVIVIIVLFTLGLFTRVTSVLTWLVCISYIHRNQQILFGQDTMMNILLIYLMIANSGATLSLDRLLNKYRAIRHSLRQHGQITPAVQNYLDQAPRSISTNFAQRMLQIHFCFIYMASALSKLKGTTWWNHAAPWDIFANPEFTMLYQSWYQAFLRELGENRIMLSIVFGVIVVGTIFLELGLPFLIWTRLRPVMIMFGMLFHAGIGVCMGLLIFSQLMMAMLLSYLPGKVIRQRLFGPPATERIPIHIDARSPEQQRAAGWLLALDVRQAFRLEIHTSSDHNIQPMYCTIAGTKYSGEQFLPNIMKQHLLLRWLRPILVLPVVGSSLKNCLAAR